MDDLTGKISEILSDPHAMEQVSALAGMLGLQGQQNAPAASPPPQPPPQAPPVANAAEGGGSLLGALGNLGNLGSLGNSLGNLGGLGALSGLLGGNAGQASAPAGGAGNPLGGLNTDMMQSVMKILPLLSTFQQEDEHTHLLQALRPLLSEERQKKLDEAAKIMKMLRLLPLLKTQGIL